ncbi:FAD-dependent oxidoreductase [Halosimplex sp. J119]
MTLAAVDRYRPDRIHSVGDRAVVLGGSVAGLCAARVLADGFDEVAVVERDPLPDEPVARDGAPQSSHPHALLEAGQATLEDFFPGFGEDLVDAGGLIIDVTKQLVEYQQGGFVADGPTRTPSYCASRPLLESVIRARVRELDPVRLRGGCRFVDYRTDDGATAITGVAVRDGDGPTEAIDADLVVDATGRTSRTPEWLADNGYPAPREDRVEIDLQYSSLRVERPPGDRRMINVPLDAPRTRGAVALPIEDGQWDVILAGVHGAGAPSDREGVLEFADSLPIDLIADILRSQPWVSDGVDGYPFPASMRRRYEDLDRFPDGLVVTGDAVSSFNPVYGQGMSIAALDALVLHHALADDGLDRLAPRFFDAVAPVLDTPWQMATGGDYQYDETDGDPSLATEAFNWYFSRLLRQAHDDGVLAEAYGDVVGLERSPAALLRPRIFARVLLPIGDDSASDNPERREFTPPERTDSARGDESTERKRTQKPL